MINKKELKCRIERGDYSLEGINDPNIPGSLIKFWLRDLATPLIPRHYYDECIRLGDLSCTPQIEEATREIIDTLPSKLLYIIIHIKITTVESYITWSSF